MPEDNSKPEEINFATLLKKVTEENEQLQEKESLPREVTNDLIPAKNIQNIVRKYVVSEVKKSLNASKIDLTDSRIEEIIRKVVNYQKIKDELHVDLVASIDQSNLSRTKFFDSKFDKLEVNAQAQLDTLKQDLKVNNQAQIDTLKENLNEQFEQFRKSESNVLSKQLISFKDEFGRFKSECIDENNKIIENHSKLLGDTEKSYRDKLEVLVENAKEILTDASTAVLTTSFKEEKLARFRSLRWSLAAFCLVVFAMLFVPVILYKYGNIQIEGWAQNPLLFVFSVAKAAALEWPLIWIASLLSKRMQLQQRVYEEYSHKYAAALSYSALRKDIKAMGKDCEGIANSTELKKFTDNLADAIYLNPSEVFDKKVESGSPSEGIVKIVDKFGAEGFRQALTDIGDKLVKK